MNNIHPSAIIDRTAELGDNLTIGPFCVIGPHVEIGNGTKLHSHVTIESFTTIGRDNEIYPYSVIGAAPQDLKYRGEEALLIIGDRNIVREHVTIHRGTANGNGVTRIGNDNLLMVACHIAHDCQIGSHCVIANQVMLGGHAILEDHVSIGGGAGIHHFTTVGTFAFVSGLVRVKKDVPPYMKLEGEPAEVRGVNTVAMNRWSIEDAEVTAVREAYKRLFMRSNGHRHDPDDPANHNGVTAQHTENSRKPQMLAMSNVIEQLNQEFAGSVCVRRLCEFLEKSGDGVYGRHHERERKDNKYAPLQHQHQP